MKLHLLLLVYLNIFWIRCSKITVENEEKADDTDSINEVQVKDTFYPHTVGIMNPRYNCYMNAVFSCLYYIPFFQDAVYSLVEEIPELPLRKDSTLLSLADIFVKMRLGSQPVRLDMTMFPAIRQSMGWQVGEYQCVLEFWGSFVETMPAKFKELFQVKVLTNYIRKSDDRVIKSIPDIYNYINIPVPREPISISSIMKNQFLDNEAEDYNILPSEQNEYRNLFTEPITERISIPVKSTVSFTNKPNVLVFGVKRLNYNFRRGDFELNEVPVSFDSFSLDEEIYKPVAHVIFNKEHYFAIVKDASHGVSFLYNDTAIHIIDADSHVWANFISRQSVLVFYVKESSLTTFTKENLARIKGNNDIPSPISEWHLTQKRDERRAAQKRKSNSSISSYYKSKKRKSTKKLKPIPESAENFTEANNEDVEEVKEEAENSEAEYFSSSSCEAEQDHLEKSDSLDPSTSETQDVDQSTSDTEDLDLELIHTLIDNSPSNNDEELDNQAKEQENSNDEMRRQISATQSATLEDITDNAYLSNFSNSKIKNIENMPLLLQNIYSQQGLSNVICPSSSSPFVLHSQTGQQPVFQQVEDQMIHKQAVQQHNQERVYYLQQQQREQEGTVNQQQDEPVNQQNSNINFNPQEQSRRQILKKLLIKKYGNEINLYSVKLTDPNYILGRENFSFWYLISGQRSHVLELVLGAFASNSVIVRKFFALSSEDDPNKLENMISTALVQMLIGVKDISLFDLNSYLRREGKIRILDKDNENFNGKLYKLLYFLSNNLNPELMPLTNLKKISYSELDTDEPIHISSMFSVGIPTFNPDDFIYPRRSNIPGMFFDSNCRQSRLRHVLNTSGLIFPVIFHRNRSDMQLSDLEVFDNTIDYAIIGGILFDDEKAIYSEFVSTHAANAFLRFSNKTGGTFNNYESIKDHIKYFNEFMRNNRKNSIALFVVKNSCWNVYQILSQDIPKFLAKSALKRIQEQMTVEIRKAMQAEDQQSQVVVQEQIDGKND
jgi:hypothetical protein